jgi:hypothetical protein
MIKKPRFISAAFLAERLPSALPVPSRHARYGAFPASRIFLGRGLSHDIKRAVCEQPSPLPFRFCSFCALPTAGRSPRSHPIPTP